MAAALCVAASLGLSLSPAEGKTPGGVHCYGKTCHRVSTLDEMDGNVGRSGVLRASYYDDCKSDRFNTCGLTSSGAIFRPDRADNAASPIFPDGTVLLAYNPESFKAAVLRVNSAGPYWGDRKLDVSRAAADKLGFRKKGVADLMVAIMRSPTLDEARYKKMREYDRVPGFIGTFPTFHAAHAAAVASLELDFDGVTSRVAEAATGGMPSVQAQPRPDKQEIFQHAILYLDTSAPDFAASAVSQESVTAVEARPDALTFRSVVPVPVKAFAVPAVSVTAVEPDYSWEGLKQHFSVFLASAIYRARAPAPLPAIPPPEMWSEKLVRFVWRARLQAREGLTHHGPFYDLFADLKTKAQAARMR